MPQHNPRFLVIMPCFNESASIVNLLLELKRELPDADLLVIDDGSSDNTAALAAPHAKVIRLVVNLGIGGAVQTGIKYAYAHGYDYCAQVDGDGQHPPAEVKRLLAHVISTGADTGIGTRFADVTSFRSTWLRRTGLRIIALTLRSLFHAQAFSDPTSGMRIHGRRAMALFSAFYPADFPEPVSIATALCNGMTLTELPVTMRERQGGVSSLSSAWRTVSYMVRVISYIVLSRIRLTLYGIWHQPADSAAR